MECVFPDFLLLFFLFIYAKEKKIRKKSEKKFISENIVKIQVVEKQFFIEENG